MEWESFHETIAELFGFPDNYGKNMDSWIDYMTHVDEPETGMTKTTLDVGESLLLEITESRAFKGRCRDQFDALVECSAIVNQRFLDDGKKAIISLVFL